MCSLMIQGGLGRRRFAVPMDQEYVAMIMNKLKYGTCNKVSCARICEA